jgi:hypothetical protein
MISFKEFFYEHVNPHHMRDSRLTNRHGAPRDGEMQGTNIVAKRYKKNDPNFNQNRVQKTGPISQGEALKLIGKHKLNHAELNVPKRLGKRPFTLHKLRNGGYVVQKINKP